MIGTFILRIPLCEQSFCFLSCVVLIPPFYSSILCDILKLRQKLKVGRTKVNAHSYTISNNIDCLEVPSKQANILLFVRTNKS